MELELVFRQDNDGHRVFHTIQGQPDDVKEAEFQLRRFYTANGWTIEERNLRPHLIRDITHIDCI